MRLILPRWAHENRDWSAYQLPTPSLNLYVYRHAISFSELDKECDIKIESDATPSEQAHKRHKIIIKKFINSSLITLSARKPFHQAIYRLEVL